MSVNDAGTPSAMLQTPQSQAITTNRGHWSPRIPSFVRSCERLLSQYERDEYGRLRRINTSQSGSEVRTAARVDANQSVITKALRSAGAFVQPLHTIGDGCPDLLVAYKGKWALIELKDGSKPPSQRKLTKDEEQWHAKASRHAPVFIAETAEDALIAIGAIKVRD